jgi:hypothetical protein
MAKKSAALVELEQKYAKALETIDQMATQQAMLTQQLGSVHRAPMMTGQLMVGIRNVSNYCVGFVDKTSGTPIEYNLNPEVPGSPDPKTRAVVSYAFWQQLRKGSQVAKGLIVRDDSVLGPADNAAPADRPEDLPAETMGNVVLHPRDWIQSKNEVELREAIAKMTSTPTLRRLAYAVDQEILRIGDEKYQGDEHRAEKSIRELPAMFRLVEELVEDRLDQLNPISKVRHLEVTQRPRSARA